MRQLHRFSELVVDRVVNDLLEGLASLLVAQVRQESLVHLTEKLLGLGLWQVLDARVNHELHEVHEQVAMVAEIQERIDRLRHELAISG